MSFNFSHKYVSNTVSTFKSCQYVYKSAFLSVYFSLCAYLNHFYLPLPAHSMADTRESGCKSTAKHVNKNLKK
jgi:hypothetical protein